MQSALQVPRCPLQVWLHEGYTDSSEPVLQLMLCNGLRKSYRIQPRTTYAALADSERISRHCRNPLRRLEFVDHSLQLVRHPGGQRIRLPLYTGDIVG